MLQKKSEKCITLKRTTNVILLSNTKVDNGKGMPNPQLHCTLGSL